MTEDMKESGPVEGYVSSFNEMGAGNASADTGEGVQVGIAPKTWLLFDHMEGEEMNESDKCLKTYNSPITEPKNWNRELPEGAKEFHVIVAQGTVQYPSLILKNENGQYDRVEIYKNKKAEAPFVAIKDGEYYPLVETELLFGDRKVRTTRHFTIVKMDPQGTYVTVSAGIPMDIETERKESNWLPQSLYQQSVDIGRLYSIRHRCRRRLPGNDYAVVPCQAGMPLQMAGKSIAGVD